MDNNQLMIRLMVNLIESVITNNTVEFNNRRRRGLDMKNHKLEMMG